MGYKRILSKSSYMQWLQCPKQLWLEQNKKEVKTPYDQSTLYLFDRGHEVGKMAWGLFPEGTLVANGEGYKNPDAAVSETKSLINSGVHTLYEAAFYNNGLYAFVDIATKMPHNNPSNIETTESWSIYEVKSSGSVKEQHINDTAVQFWIANGSGIMSPVAAYVVYVKGSQGMCLTNPWTHFGFQEVTDSCYRQQSKISQDSQELISLIKQPEPNISTGSQCKKPYQCMFLDYCMSSSLHD